MGFDNARIVLDSPTNTYYAGQTLNGRFIFSRDKVKKFRGIYARIRGYCKVHWTSRERNPHAHGGQARHRTVTHESYEDYFDHRIYLSGSSSGDHTLPPGQHDLPFSFRIPDNCPSAIEGEYGHIRYELKVVVDRAFKTDQELSAPFKVLCPLDLNMIPNAREPIHMKLEESYCCWCVNAGSSETLVKLPNTGYCPGQVIPVEVNCINRSTEEIDIKVALKKEITFTARSAPGTKQEKSKILEEKRGPVPPHVTRSWTIDIIAPEIEVHNLRNCSFISVEYDLKITVSPDGCHNDSDDSCNLIFGTIPLGATQPLQNPHTMSPTQAYPQAITQQPYPQFNQYPNAPSNPPYPANPYPTSPFPPNPYPPTPQTIGLQTSPNPNQTSPYPQSPYPPGPQMSENPPYPNPQSPYPSAPTQGAGNPPHPNPPSPYPPGPQKTENQPYPNAQSPYPPGQQNSPYPNHQSPYPPGPQKTENQPYPNAQSPYPPGPQNSPYPNHQSPYPPGPQKTENQPYPNAQSPYPPGPQNSPYPNNQSPYPPGPQKTENQPYPNAQSPYPPGPQNSPYPNHQSPYPPGPQKTENQPYPNAQSTSPPVPQNSPYPNPQSPYPSGPPQVTDTPPYPITPPGNQYPNTPNQPSSYPQNPSVITTGLKTGTFGFIHGDDKGVSIPLLPDGATVPMPKAGHAASPYAPSAPEPSTADDVNKPLMPRGNEHKTPSPPYNPNA